MTFYQERTGEEFVSTVRYPNRERDREMVSRLWGGLLESGSGSMRFFSLDPLLPLPLAVGFLRVVYGDHGPYVEFARGQVVWSSWREERRGVGWFDDFRTPSGDARLYLQRKSVAGLLNPPPGPYSVANDCPDGYADYRPGRCYVSPDEMKWEEGG